MQARVTYMLYVDRAQYAICNGRVLVYDCMIVCDVLVSERRAGRGAGFANFREVFSATWATIDSLDSLFSAGDPCSHALGRKITSAGSSSS